MARATAAQGIGAGTPSAISSVFPKFARRRTCDYSVGTVAAQATLGGTHDSGHPAAIARSTGYFSKSVQQTLNEMEESTQVLAVRHGREKHFHDCESMQAAAATMLKIVGRESVAAVPVDTPDGEP